MTNFSRRIRQAPWRTRRQTVGMVLLVIVGVSMIAALYLSVAARTTLVGREIQRLEEETSTIREENANLKTELASLLSYAEIEERSDQLGFYAATAAETHYLVVPGYTGRQPVNLVEESDEAPAESLLSEAYTQSLVDWVGEQLLGGAR